MRQLFGRLRNPHRAGLACARMRSLAVTAYREDTKRADEAGAGPGTERRRATRQPAGRAETHAAAGAESGGFGEGLSPSRVAGQGPQRRPRAATPSPPVGPGQGPGRPA